MNSPKNFSKNVLLSMLLLGSFAPLIAADSAQETEARNRHILKLYHAISTEDQACVDRIMKESKDSPAVQLKALLDAQGSKNFTNNDIIKAAAVFAAVGIVTEMVLKATIKLLTGKTILI